MVYELDLLRPDDQLKPKIRVEDFFDSRIAPRVNRFAFQDQRVSRGVGRGLELAEDNVLSNKFDNFQHLTDELRKAADRDYAYVKFQDHRSLYRAMRDAASLLIFPANE